MARSSDNQTKQKYEGKVFSAPLAAKRGFARTTLLSGRHRTEKGATMRCIPLHRATTYAVAFVFSVPQDRGEVY